jgi:hypothetical protein
MFPALLPTTDIIRPLDFPHRQYPDNVLLVELELILIQPSPKKLVPKPLPIRVDHVGLAVVCDLLDPTGVEVSLYPNKR